MYKITKAVILNFFGRPSTLVLNEYKNKTNTQTKGEIKKPSIFEKKKNIDLR